MSTRLKYRTRLDLRNAPTQPSFFDFVADGINYAISNAISNGLQI